MADFEGKKSSNDIKNNCKMSDDEIVASDVPRGTCLLIFCSCFFSFFFCGLDLFFLFFLLFSFFSQGEKGFERLKSKSGVGGLCRRRRKDFMTQARRRQ